ncbi:MAG: hypothetical protein QM270_01020 [Bacillota bacterium]|nr:hypothetical protein [Bacillota bacterium]
MKCKRLMVPLLLILCLFRLSATVSADMGPKPSVSVEVTGLGGSMHNLPKIKWRWFYRVEQLSRENAYVLDSHASLTLSVFSDQQQSALTINVPIYH